MCFKRKSSLGRYNANRADWVRAYRKARLELREGKKPDPTTSGVIWKAALIVNHELNEICDPLTIPVLVRLDCLRMINEIISE